MNTAVIVELSRLFALTMKPAKALLTDLSSSSVVPNVPLGYQVDGRTLKIDEAEATTIRTLYELYLEHGLIRIVKQRAEDLELRSRKRVRGAGRVSGGRPFDRGHIHHILSNPIYAGRIRHKGQVYDGQHNAIIAPEVWDRVQQMLQNGAAKPRGTKRKTRRSPLVGKLFDESGDRLTPTQQRQIVSSFRNLCKLYGRSAS